MNGAQLLNDHGILLTPLAEIIFRRKLVTAFKMCTRLGIVTTVRVNHAEMKMWLGVIRARLNGFFQVALGLLISPLRIVKYAKIVIKDRYEQKGDLV